MLSKHKVKDPHVVFKSLVWSGFFPFLEETATTTGFLQLKNYATATRTIKDWSVLVSFGSTTGLNQFSHNWSLTGLSQLELFSLSLFVLIYVHYNYTYCYLYSNYTNYIWILSHCVQVVIVCCSKNLKTRMSLVSKWIK